MKTTLEIDKEIVKLRQRKERIKKKKERNSKSIVRAIIKLGLRI